MRQLFPLAALLIAGCVPRVVPPPAPAPAPAPAPPPAAPTPAPAPAPTLTGDWRDWPLTPGEWRYRRTAGGGVSSFGVPGATPSVTLTCDRATRRLTLVRAGASSAAMTIVTTSTTRTVPSRPDGAGGTAASVAATDSLLDAIGYSRGRFVIQQAGLPTLVVPAWPEIERVTEDCRG
jgi:hypothetical protein